MEVQTNFQEPFEAAGLVGHDGLMSVIQFERRVPQ